MFKNSILKMQQKLQEEIPDLNRGGCIWFAVYFVDILKQKKIPYKVYSCNDYEGTGRTYKEFNGSSHIVIYIDNLGYFDGHKFINHLNNFRYIKHLKLKNLQRLAEKEGCWNNEYDKSEYNNKLEQIIKNYIV